jgi:hypothetical protein
MMQRVIFRKSDGSGFSVDLTNLETGGVSEADFNFSPPEGATMVKGAMDF